MTIASVVILAAGRGTRVKSFPKLLLPLARRPVLAHVLATISEVQAQHCHVVVPPYNPTNLTNPAHSNDPINPSMHSASVDLTSVDLTSVDLNREVIASTPPTHPQARISQALETPRHAVRQWVESQGAGVLNGVRLSVVEQPQPLGTADALLCAVRAMQREGIWEHLQGHASTCVVVVNGDVPLIGRDAIKKVAQRALETGDPAMLTFFPKDPKGYGRVVRVVSKAEGVTNRIAQIIENKDWEQRLEIGKESSERARNLEGLSLKDQEEVRTQGEGQECYVGVVALPGRALAKLMEIWSALPRNGGDLNVATQDEKRTIHPKATHPKATTFVSQGVTEVQNLQRPAQEGAREFYITLLPTYLPTQAVVLEEAWRAQGVNTLEELSRVERYWQEQRCKRAMAEGVLIVDPQHVWFAYDTRVAEGSIVEPNVVFGDGVRVGRGCVVKSFSYLEGVTVEDNVHIGPFARIRGQSTVASTARVGSFVELKNANLGIGVKANHLAYLGDVQIGRGSNIGAGSVVCNFDGVHKHATSIGEDCFIGSNTSLVAPLTIQDGALVGAGSVITESVDANTVVVERAPVKKWQRRRVDSSSPSTTHPTTHHPRHKS